MLAAHVPALGADIGNLTYSRAPDAFWACCQKGQRCTRATALPEYVRLLLQEVVRGGLGGLFFERQVHALVTAILLRLARLDAFDGYT